MKASPNTILIAVTVIFIGVILLLGNMGIISNNMVALWPVILIIAGLVGLTLLDGNPLKRSTSASTHIPASKKKTVKKRT